jgi:hypothetical protein
MRPRRFPAGGGYGFKSRVVAPSALTPLPTGEHRRIDP